MHTLKHLDKKYTAKYVGMQSLPTSQLLHLGSGSLQLDMQRRWLVGNMLPYAALGKVLVTTVCATPILSRASMSANPSAEADGMLL